MRIRRKVAEKRREWEKRIGREALDDVDVDRDDENCFVIDLGPIVWVKRIEWVVGLSIGDARKMREGEN